MSSKSSANCKVSLNGGHDDPSIRDLSQLLASLKSFNPSDPSSPGDIASLLQTIEQADGIAQGVEAKLDILLQDLEGIIGGLENSPGESGRKSGTRPGDELEREVAEALLSDDKIDKPAEDGKDG